MIHTMAAYYSELYFIFFLNELVYSLGNPALIKCLMHFFMLMTIFLFLFLSLCFLLFCFINMAHNNPIICDKRVIKKYSDYITEYA